VWWLAVGARETGETRALQRLHLGRLRVGEALPEAPWTAAGPRTLARAGELIRPLPLSRSKFVPVLTDSADSRASRVSSEIVAYTDTSRPAGTAKHVGSGQPECHSGLGQ
jgi:hypothetical protein